LVARRRPLGRGAQEEAERDEPLAGAGRQVERDVERAAGRDGERRQLRAAARLAVDGQLPGPAVAVERGEEMAVADAEAAAAQRLDPHGLREELQLVQRRVR